MSKLHCEISQNEWGAARRGLMENAYKISVIQNLKGKYNLGHPATGEQMLKQTWSKQDVTGAGLL
jgi:hypothetical protein